MNLTIGSQRRYDHRLRKLVCKFKSVDVAVRHGVPRSTARGWLAPTPTPVVTLNALSEDAVRLQREVVALRQRVDRLVALLRLMALLFKLSGASLCRVQIPEGLAKARLLRTSTDLAGFDPLCSIAWQFGQTGTIFESISIGPYMAIPSALRTL